MGDQMRITFLLRAAIYTFITIFLFTSSLLSQQMFQKIFSGDIGNSSGISAGLCWGDYNNDGLIDLFITNWNNQHNSLYKNEGNGILTRITEGVIVNDRGFSSGPTWADYDNDGFLDLFVANQQNQNNFLYHNNGDGTFQKIIEGDIVSDYGDSYSSAWADYNLDGYLDLYVANSSSQGNFLYKNNGDGTFKRIKNGEIVKDKANSFGSSWGDYNNDGYPDLFVANKGGINNTLYKNNKDGTFQKITESKIVNDGGNSNGASWGDYNNDGYLDLYVTNGAFFFTGENNFLYKNNGDGTFSKIESTIPTSDNAKSMSANWADFDNDGDLDLFVTNYVHDDLLYLNNGDGTFKKNTTDFLVNLAGYATGTGTADLDNDGDLDIATANWENQNNNVFLNSSHQKNWIGIKLNGIKSNKKGIGAKIELKVDSIGHTNKQYREISAGHGFRSQSTADAFFGFGEDTIINSVSIIWPSGLKEVIKEIDKNQYITVTEGSGITGTFQAEVSTSLPPFMEIIYKTYTDKGIDAAIRHYHDLKKTSFSEYSFAEYQLNNLGYRLLGQDKIDQAIHFFRLNADEHPESVNVYDSLAEALLLKGQNDEAEIQIRKLLKVLKNNTTLSESQKEFFSNNAKYKLKNIK